MRSTVAVYLRLVRVGLRTQSAYPLAAVAGVAANSMFGVIKASILTAAVASAGVRCANTTLPR